MIYLGLMFLGFWIYQIIWGGDTHHEKMEKMRQDRKHEEFVKRRKQEQKMWEEDERKREEIPDKVKEQQRLYKEWLDQQRSR